MRTHKRVKRVHKARAAWEDRYHREMRSRVVNRKRRVGRRRAK